MLRFVRGLVRRGRSTAGPPETTLGSAGFENTRTVLAFSRRPAGLRNFYHRGVAAARRALCGSHYTSRKASELSRRPAADASTASPLKYCRVARDASMASRKCHGPGKQDFVMHLACAVARLLNPSRVMEDECRVRARLTISPDERCSVFGGVSLRKMPILVPEGTTMLTDAVITHNRCIGQVSNVDTRGPILPDNKTRTRPTVTTYPN